MKFATVFKRWLQTTAELPNRVPTVYYRNSKKSGISDALYSIHGYRKSRVNISWFHPPKTVFLLKKPNDEKTTVAFTQVVQYINEEHPDIKIIVEPDVYREQHSIFPNLYTINDPTQIQDYSRVTDFVITLGGDGCILHAASLFLHDVPPILSFSLGSLGFLLPFAFNNYKKAIKSLIMGKVNLLLRMRLNCEIQQRNSDPVKIIQAMNEITFHRGISPHMTIADIRVDEEYLTNCYCDGLIISSPTGSTAYSLSAGGPIVHPAVQSIGITPICPRSLSFRPILLPGNSSIKLQLNEKSRGIAQLTIDGKDVCSLERDEFVEINRSDYPIPVVNRIEEDHKQDEDTVSWVKDLSKVLNWNQNFSGRR